jgi:hypothetical protein
MGYGLEYDQPQGSLHSLQAEVTIAFARLACYKSGLSLVLKVDPKTTELTVLYPDDDQIEDGIVAADLIREGHIAISERR